MRWRHLIPWLLCIKTTTQKHGSNASVYRNKYKTMHVLRPHLHLSLSYSPATIIFSKIDIVLYICTKNMHISAEVALGILISHNISSCNMTKSECKIPLLQTPNMLQNCMKTGSRLGSDDLKCNILKSYSEHWICLLCVTFTLQRQILYRPLHCIYRTTVVAVG